MARCFPYMPPNCTAEVYSDREPPVESIKLQKDNTKTNGNKKEKIEKAEKSKEVQHTEHSHKKKKHHERCQLNQKNDQGTTTTTTTTKDVIEQLEKSGLTEENGLPCSIPNPYDSSDSTQDSSKRRRLVAPDVSHCNSGLTLRIKLPLQKHTALNSPVTAGQPCQGSAKAASEVHPCFSSRALEKIPLLKYTDPSPKRRETEPRTPNGPTCLSGRVMEMAPLQKQKAAELSTTASEQPCSPGRTLELLPLRKYSECLVQRLRDPEPSITHGQACSSGGAVEIPPLQKHKAMERPATTSEQPCFSGRVAEPAAVEIAGKQSCSGKKQHSSSRIKKMESKFRELIVNLRLPSMAFEDQEGGANEWLLGSRRQHGNPSGERCRGNSTAEHLDHGSGVNPLQPRACYLPEFDMYELPYVIPY